MLMQCHNVCSEKHTICLVTRLSDLRENSLSNEKEEAMCLPYEYVGTVLNLFCI